ncbi:nuclear transport factor 2 family protein [Lusitaniella coriacea LEGE 07157]|uniref:Nuclear transport factor 2 family protein n=1 Tax=Lusitaniella coriacea LEGE 07157 TaxID=945747 RepID=A0A8J7DND2_9CYAN|nr:nuclear transport factor 2 family protein [Lusitaniella coriacea]MBE9114399.1 nuclear transport factor 2 family protein [Lusitaniella coriacea LEGE 07157]
MTHPPDETIRHLRDAYAAFNNRDADAVLSLMTSDVVWPRAFKGGFVEGPDAIRAYWTEQWGEIDGTVDPVSFETDETGRINVTVHQVVRDLDGNVLADNHVCHRFTMDRDLIAKMDLPDAP